MLFEPQNLFWYLQDFQRLMKHDTTKRKGKSITTSVTVNPDLCRTVILLANLPSWRKKKTLILCILYCNMSKCNGKNLCLFLLMLKLMFLRTEKWEPENYAKDNRSNLLYILLNLWHTLHQNKSPDQILIYLLYNLRHWEDRKRISVSNRRIKLINYSTNSIISATISENHTIITSSL